MYYTNTRCMDQKYILNPGGMYSLFASTVTLSNAEIFAVDAFQAYSTAGKSTLFEINNCYNPVSNPYNIEIDQTYNYTNPGCDAPAGSYCVTVPGYTAGYVKIQVNHGPVRLAEITEPDVEIYPNPTMENLFIVNDAEVTHFYIYDITGTIISSGEYLQQPISIQSLPQGLYQLVLHYEQGENKTTSFIKL